MYIGKINSKYKIFPLFNLSNNKLIGWVEIMIKILREEFLKRYKYPYKFKMNEIEILIKIKKEDINKEIYFLDKGYETF